MSQEILIAIIGLLSAVFGSIFTLILATLNFKLKLKEINISFKNERRNKYLENARTKIDTIYKPLQNEITKIDQSFRNLKIHLTTKNQFITDLSQTIDSINKILSDGNELFLTTELADYLQSFISFIGYSIVVNHPEEIISVGYDILKVVPLSDEIKDELYKSNNPPLFDLLSNLKLSFISSLEIVIEPQKRLQRRKILIGAPIDSEKFENRFALDIMVIRELLREVSLGSKKIDDDTKFS